MTSARKIKLRLAQVKPRNPLVVAARQRKAGSHRKSERSARQQAQRELKRVIDE